MNRIDTVFRELKEKKKKAFIPYITAGDPDMKATKDIVRALAGAGADVIEIGIPFSDPLADGPTIQRAIERALSKGASVAGVFRMVRELRKDVQAPFVFMTYYNIVLNYGLDEFVKEAKRCGVDGIIVPDLPMEESAALSKASGKNDFALILLTAPTTPAKRFARIAAHSRGFIYHVSLTGVTGARRALAESLLNDIRKLKKFTQKPVCVGFGVSTPGQARYVAKAADGVIVGSALINVLEKNMKNRKRMISAVETFARSIARAVHAA